MMRKWRKNEKINLKLVETCKRLNILENVNDIRQQLLLMSMELEAKAAELS